MLVGRDKDAVCNEIQEQIESGGTVTLWCLHCERTFMSAVPEGWKPDDSALALPAAGKPDTWELKPGVMARRCFYSGCDGSPIDWWLWANVRREVGTNKERYPRIPNLGERYPLYSKESGSR